jgi:phosphoglycerate dehydrogenase-like enzyme
MAPPRLRVSVPTTDLLRELDASWTDVEIIEWSMAGPAPTESIDIVVVPYMTATNTLEQLRGVATRLVQGQSLGYDGVAESLPPGFVFANASGVHESATAELTLALILASQRGIPDFVRAASEGRWARALYPGLADQTVVLVGYGGVGKAIEARLLPFEVTVVRVANTQRSDDRGIVHAVSSLPELLPTADVVVVVVPLKPATFHLVDDAFLSSMRDDSLFVNVGRGPVADTDALVAHASRGRLRIALDVTDPEPLPDGHALFALSNVLISPHVGGVSPAMRPRIVSLLHEQIERMLRDDDPINVVVRS